MAMIELIAKLRLRIREILSSSKIRKDSVADHPAFGMWKDREDMEDVDKAVREMRKDRADSL